MADLPQRCAPLARWSRDQPLELVGPPGVGKSWVARRWADAVGDVVVVSLDGVTRADAVVHELAVQLGVDDDDQAFRALVARAPNAWVLDDAEGAAEALRALQPSLPAVPLLVTSRRRVGLARASVVDVGPLDPEAAAALFVERARDARHGFDPGPHAAAITEICARLDGLPLALELAAARVRALTPRQVLDRLSLDHLEDLRRSERHQSLRRALAATVDSLTAEGQEMLSVASVFLGPFTLEALEAAGAGDLQALEELMDAGLLQRGEGAQLRLLAPVRAFATERTQRPEILDAVHAWLVAEAEATAPWQEPRFWSGWRRELERAVERGGELGARAAIALGRREEAFGPIGAQQARAAPLLVDPDLSDDLRAALHRSIAVEALVRTDYDLAEASVQAALALAPSGQTLGELLVTQAQMLSDQRASDRVEELLNEALAAWSSTRLQAEAALIRSIDRLRKGDPQGAQTSAQRALSIASGQDFAPLQALGLAFLADAERHVGVRAGPRLERLERARQLQGVPPKYRALVAMKRSTALADAGRFDEALQALEAPIRRMEKAGDHLFSVGERLLQVAFAIGAGDAEEARRRLEVVPLEPPHYAGVLRTLRQAQVAHALGDVEGARTAYKAIEALEGSGYRARREEARAFRAALDGERAEGFYDEVLALAHSGPELHAHVEARGRWEARLLARLLRPAVRVAQSGRWFEVGAQRHDLGRKATLVRVLAGLAARVGRPVPLEEVLAFGWPGESPRGSSGRARVHVAISSLRKLGLQGALWTAPGDDLAYVLEAEPVDDTVSRTR